MAFKFSASRKGTRLTATTSSAFHQFDTTGGQPLASSGMRVQNTDPTNGLYVISGNSGAAPTADNTCHYVGPGLSVDMIRKDSDDGVALLAVAGTPAVVVHLGSAGLAD